LFDTVACASYRRLDAGIGASERHDFAVRISAFVRLAIARLTPPRPPHPRPAFRDVRNAPLSGRDGLDMHLIWVGGEAKYF